MSVEDALTQLYDDTTDDLWLVVRGVLSPSEFLDHLAAKVREVRAEQVEGAPF